MPQRTATQLVAWSEGRLTARYLLQSRTLDTNGIYTRQKTFPADFLGRTASGPSGSGYTLQHVVAGSIFDTLLVSCQYLAHADIGDNCDFITPSGFLVYSNVESRSRFRVMPDAATLAGMGGKPVSNRVVAKARREAAPASWVKPGFDIRGRWTETARACVAFPGPGR